MNKKFLSCVCAGAMALSLAAPAFAASNPIANGASVDFTGQPADGEIAVVMQTGSTKLYVNPYGLPFVLGYGEVSISGGATFDKTKDLAIKEPETASEGFFSDTAVIQNNGAIDLDVKVSMTTTEKGDLVFVAAASDVTAGNITKQVMYGNLEIATATLSTGTAKVTTTAAQAGPPAVDAVKSEMDGVQIVTPDWANKQTVVIPAGAAGADSTDVFTATAGKGAASAVTNTNVVLAASETVTDSLGTSTTTPGFVAYRLAGTAVPADKETGSNTSPAAWTDADVADVNVAFTFTPHAAVAPGP